MSICTGKVPQPWLSQIATLPQDGGKYMLLLIPSGGFQEEKLYLLHTNISKEAEIGGAGDGGDSLGHGRAAGYPRTPVSVLAVPRVGLRCSSLPWAFSGT